MNVFKSLALVGMWFATIATAATFEGTQVSKIVERTGKNLRGEASATFQLASEIFRVTVKREVVAETVWTCENDVPADGKGGDWKGFFSATKEDKPYRLAEAIKGIGVETARRLVNDGFFDSKPRSWADFKKKVQEADNEFQTGFSYDVIVKFGKENMINLGYLVEGQCGYKTEMVERLVPVRTFVRNEVRQYQVRINNAPLLNGESEKITVSFDGVEDSINVNSYYNDYKIDRWNQNGQVVFDLAGVRKQVRPANDLNVTANVANGKLELSVTNTAFDAEVAAMEDMTIVGKVEIDKGSWKNTFSRQSTLDLGTFEKALSKTSSETNVGDVGVQIPAGTNVTVSYEVRVNGSRFHSNEKSSSKKLKLKLK